MLVLALFAFSSAGSPAADFERDIRPLLNERCTECHGEKKQKGELRLDAKSFAFKGGHGGPAFIPGKPKESPVFKRVTSQDEEERMPPRGEPLTTEQIELVRGWIEGGADWPENETDRAAAQDQRYKHWSVQPPSKVFPEGACIDLFISKELQNKNLKPAPEADRRTLIRRLSFDLTGLPPSPERVAKFTSDTSPDAYQQLVEELLNSPHYGERWARHWLDIAHYADTHGFERDQLRPNAWRYRDYVIDSLNADKPYSQFLTEQIAGDTLSPRTTEGVIASGFLAAGPWDFVGHVETKSPVLKRAARAGDLDDIVTQVITSTMGITINCARCHDHKLDPISQREYYSLCAVFAGVRRGDRDIDPIQAKILSDNKSKLQGELEKAKIILTRHKGSPLDLADIIGGGNGYGTGTKGSGIIIESGVSSTKNLGYSSNTKANTLRVPVRDAAKGEIKILSGVFVPNGVDAESSPLTLADSVVLANLPKTSGQTWDAVRNGPLNGQVQTKIDGIDYNSGEHSILGLHANSGATFDLSEVRKTSGQGPIQFSAKLGFGASPGAAETKADFAVYVDSERVYEAKGLRKTETRQIDVTLADSARFLTLVATDGGDGIGSDLLYLGDARLFPSKRDQSAEPDTEKQVAAARQGIERLQKEINALQPAPQVYAVTSDAEPPVVKIQKRGNPEEEGAEVQPAAFAWANHAPAEFGTSATAEGSRRAALTRWITHPGNPLTRRVLVNRLWHHHFGQGLVLTPSDFGLGGDRPSHPELLDWLAEEFLRAGWSIKHMHRLIVNSSAYKQRSDVNNAQAEAMDSGNRLLWRQNVRRLDAETVRDAVLATSGQLNPKRGGPGYRDFKYTEAYAPVYEYTTGDDPETMRRSIYRFVVRTTPHQFLTTLDCPNPANLTPARSQTTTALQALALSNNPFMLQQARHMATRLENETGNQKDAVSRAFELCFQRSPLADEHAVAARLGSDHGLFSLCRMLLNANEFIYLD